MKVCSWQLAVLNGLQLPTSVVRRHMLLTSVLVMHQSWNALLVSLLLFCAYMCSIEIECVLFLLVCAGICCCQIC